ncbi:MAG: hypothetical protein WCP28_15470, partial [Actinomycetes bacterium]
QGTNAGSVLTGQTAAREQKAMRLDPDRLREAPPGLTAVVESGQPVRWAAVCPPTDNETARYAADTNGELGHEDDEGK